MKRDVAGWVLPLLAFAAAFPVAIGRGLGFDIPEQHAALAAGVATLAILTLTIGVRRRT